LRRKIFRLYKTINCKWKFEKDEKDTQVKITLNYIKGDYALEKDFDLGLSRIKANTEK